MDIAFDQHRSLKIQEGAWPYIRMLRKAQTQPHRIDSCRLGVTAVARDFWDWRLDRQDPTAKTHDPDSWSGSPKLSNDFDRLGLRYGNESHFQNVESLNIKTKMLITEIFLEINNEKFGTKIFHEQ